MKAFDWFDLTVLDVTGLDLTGLAWCEMGLTENILFSGIRCVNNSSVQLLFEMFFTLMNIEQVMLRIHTEMHVGLHVKRLLKFFEPNGRGSRVICLQYQFH